MEWTPWLSVILSVRFPTRECRFGAVNGDGLFALLKFRKKNANKASMRNEGHVPSSLR